MGDYQDEIGTDFYAWPEVRLEIDLKAEAAAFKLLTRAMDAEKRLNELQQECDNHVATILQERKAYAKDNAKWKDAESCLAELVTAAEAAMSWLELWELSRPANKRLAAVIEKAKER